MATDAPRRLTLLYQLYLTNQAARHFMRLALSGSEMSGEEYGLYSYLYANGPRTLSQAARDYGLPITTLATMLGPLVDAGEVERTPHPTDGRARLLALTPAGRERLEQAIPAFSAAYRGLLTQLDAAGADGEELFAALDGLRSVILRTNALLESEGG
jgi:DNA-binding MarR family transcriptional regulator